tara:strand:- start:114 stop:380 length:267 start_codon:yes stop_codon:yes gene_type:complete
MIKFINKENYKFIIIFLGILILGILYYGNYNLIEGNANVDSDCKTNDDYNTASCIGARDPVTGKCSSTESIQNMSQTTCSLRSQNPDN